MQWTSGNYYTLARLTFRSSVCIHSRPLLLFFCFLWTTNCYHDCRCLGMNTLSWRSWTESSQLPRIMHMALSACSFVLWHSKLWSKWAFRCTFIRSLHTSTVAMKTYSRVPDGGIVDSNGYLVIYYRVMDRALYEAGKKHGIFISSNCDVTETLWQWHLVN